MSQRQESVRKCAEGRILYRTSPHEWAKLIPKLTPTAIAQAVVTLLQQNTEII
jgi:hypothetical protein